MIFSHLFSNKLRSKKKIYRQLISMSFYLGKKISEQAYCPCQQGHAGVGITNSLHPSCCTAPRQCSHPQSHLNLIPSLYIMGINACLVCYNDFPNNLSWILSLYCIQMFTMCIQLYCTPVVYLSVSGH